MESNVENLNELLSDLEVMSVKLQNYHWNVQGKGFFQTHEKLEEYYNEIREQIDEIAEHILILGYQPLGTLQDFSKNSEIFFNGTFSNFEKSNFFSPSKDGINFTSSGAILCKPSL